MSFQESFDLVLRDARVKGCAALQDIGVTNGRIAAIGQIAAGAGRKDEAVGGRLVLPGFVPMFISTSRASCAVAAMQEAG